MAFLQVGIFSSYLAHDFFCLFMIRIIVIHFRYTVKEILSSEFICDVILETRMCYVKKERFL